MEVLLLLGCAAALCRGPPFRLRRASRRERVGAGSGTAVAPAKPGELSGAGILGQQEVRQMALETRI
jgi:hypothetical protein